MTTSGSPAASTSPATGAKSTPPPGTSLAEHPDRAAFIQRYGGIYEHSPWVAERAYEEACDTDDPDRLAEVFASHVDAADRDMKLALIRAHPDLAGKAAVGARPTGDTNQELTAASKAEQQSAGIDQCTKEEFERF